MKTLMVLAAAAACASFSAKADEYQDMSQFAQNICGDIPSGTLSKTTIKGAVQANAGILARIVSGNANASADTVREVYNGVPLDRLPDNIPTVAMCKSELVKVLLLRKKIVANTCRHPDFGQEGWGRTETYSNSSGRVGGGGDQNQWCNQVASSFISSRSIGPQNKVERISSNEESDKDFLGHVTYKYYCTIKVSWDPTYVQKQDASHCGTHEE
jgi:hypothetical protein